MDTNAGAVNEGAESNREWLTMTYRRLTDDPMRVVWRFVWAMLGGWLAMGMFVYSVWQGEPSVQSVGNALMLGQFFGTMTGILALLAGEYPSRLRGLLPGWLNVLVWGILGLLWGVLTWGAYRLFFLNAVTPVWGTFVLGGIGLALGFLLTALLDLPGWLAVLLTAAAIFGAIYLSQDILLTAVGEPLLYFGRPEQLFTLGIPFALLIAVGGHARRLFKGRS